MVVDTDRLFARANRLASRAGRQRSGTVHLLSVLNALSINQWHDAHRN